MFMFASARATVSPARCLAVLCLLVSSGPGSAGDSQPYQEYDQRIRASQQVDALKSDLFGENVSMFDGRTEFSVADISLPGNNVLPVELRRRLAVTPERQTVFSQKFGGVGNWEVDVPHIAGTFEHIYKWNVGISSSNRCSSAFIPRASTGTNIYDIWSGNSIHIPGGSDTDMLRALSNSPYQAAKPRIWTTRDFATFTCVPMKFGYPGEGFVMHTKDGIKYIFDVGIERTAAVVRQGVRSVPRVRVYLLASRIEDRFGNSVNYSYNGQGHPVLISSSDGRSISLTYDASGNNLESATAGTRLWTYHYTSGKLSNVILPDGVTKWTFAYTGDITLPFLYEEPLGPTCEPEFTPGTFGVTITHPSGAIGTFQFSHRRQWRSGVSRSTCAQVPPTALGAPITYRSLTPGFFDVFGLRSKSISGAGLGAPLVSTYSYGGLVYPLSGSGTPGLCPTCPSRKIASVREPNGTRNRYHFGVLYGFNEGKLLGVYTKNTNDQVVRAETYVYMTDTQASSGQAFANTYGIMWGGNEPSASKIRPILKTIIAEGGLIEEPPQSANPPPPPPPSPPPPRHPCNPQTDICEEQPCEPTPYFDCEDWLVVGEEPPLEAWGEEATAKSADTPTFTNQILSFDLFARPLSATKFSSLGFSRTEATIYEDNVARWVLSQIHTVTCMTAAPVSTACNGNDVASKADYDPTTALPLKTYAFGKLQQTLAYYADGTLKTVTDGRNSTTTLSSWKRGIPQMIQHPATPDQPAGSSQSAAVNNNGWIDSVVDENGYRTCYTHDAIGRLASITYPDEVNIGACDIDESHWKKTLISFHNNYGEARGLPARHWRQIIETGKGRKVMLFDALWRPVIEQTYDNTSTATVEATLSEVAKRYDSSGRLAFQSYPSRIAIDFDEPGLKGIRTEYDALDRVTAVRQDSELGVLSTTTVYTPNRLKTEVTNPNGRATHTWYMAYDQPHYDWPIQTYHPESVVTEIARDALGKPLTLARRNLADTISATRQYLYNVSHELCKVIEPETGSTVMHYDGAGNLDWSAAGLALPSTTSCDDTHGSIAARKVSRTYDARNRLKTLRFPDTRGNQDWFYTPDGLPSKVVTVNVPGAVHPENIYTYNKRRLPKTELQALPEWYTFSLEYQYNANGHLTKLFYPSGQSVDFVPNALGQATRVLGGTGHIFASEVTYHPNGAIERFKYGNGIVHTMTPNERQLPRFVADAGIFSLDYRYDGNGNVDTVFDSLRGAWGHRSMDYDGLDRLTHVGFAQLGGNHHMYFTYDALDNLKTWKHPADGSGNMVRDHLYCYDAKNRLQFVRSGATACNNGSAADYFQYDVQGNVEIHNEDPFDFDYGNRLREVIDKERYRYDAHGRRILANNFITGTITSQYGGNGQLLYQKNARTGQNKEIDHIYLGGSLIAQREASLDTGAASAKYIHTDALGSPVAVTDQSGTMIGAVVDYEPYGRQLDSSTIIGRDRPGYTGHVLDVATGLDYMQQRYYDPGIGRFLSVDPVTADGNTGANFNRYKYANNNPYKFVDPDGRCSQLVNGLVGGLPCDLQQRNLNPAHVAADEAVARDARMLVETQGEIALFVGGGGAIRSLALNATKAEAKVIKILCAIGLSGCGSNPALSEIKSPGKATREIADEIGDQLKSRAETIGRSTERLRRETPGIRPPPNKDGRSGNGKLEGFQGVFRVEGRIDSRRLDKALSGK